MLHAPSVRFVKTHHFVRVRHFLEGSKLLDHPSLVGTVDGKILNIKSSEILFPKRNLSTLGDPLIFLV